MKKAFVCFWLLVAVILLVTCMPTFAENAEWGETTCTFMCVKNDGTTLSLVVKPSWLSSAMKATIIDGSAESFTLTTVTAIRQSEEGVEIDWADIETPSTMTILGAKIVSVLF